MTQRFPITGQDDGTWGDILNGFLEVSHNADGTLVPSAVSAAGAATSVNTVTPSNGSVTLTAANIGALTQTAADARYPQSGAYVPTSAAATGKTLRATGSGTVAWEPDVTVKLDALGADPTGGSYSDATFTAALAILAATPQGFGAIELGYGTYEFQVNQNTPVGTIVKGQGGRNENTTVNWDGTGSWLTQMFVGGGSLYGGQLRGLFINGSGSGPGSTSMHYGGLLSMIFDDLDISQFTNNTVATTTSNMSTGTLVTTLPFTAPSTGLPAGLVTLTSGGNTQNYYTPGATAGQSPVPCTAQNPNFAFPSGSTVTMNSKGLWQDNWIGSTERTSFSNVNIGNCNSDFRTDVYSGQFLSGAPWTAGTYAVGAYVSSSGYVFVCNTASNTNQPPTTPVSGSGWTYIMPNTATSSHDYAIYDLFLTLNANQIGFDMGPGCRIDGSRILIRGNWGSAATNTGVILNLGLSNLSTDGKEYCELHGCQLIIQGEIDGGSTGHMPIKMASSFNSINNCTGLIYIVNTVTVSTLSSGTFNFQGPIQGDANLIAANQRLSTPTTVSGTTYQNTSGYQQSSALNVPYILNPTGAATATVTVAIGPSSASSTVATVSAPISDTTGRQSTLTIGVPRGWYYSVTATNATIGTVTLVG
jgi:hypothetical protein